MLEVDWMNFWNSFDFDTMMESYTSGYWKWIFEDRVVQAIGALLLASIIYGKTRSSGVKALTWIPVGLFYVVGGVILKNSTISQAGPFILFVAMLMFAAGYFVVTNLLQP